MMVIFVTFGIVSDSAQTVLSITLDGTCVTSECDSSYLFAVDDRYFSFLHDSDGYTSRDANLGTLTGGESLRINSIRVDYRNETFAPTQS